MLRVCVSLVLLLVGVATVMGETDPRSPPRPPSITFTEEPPRFRVRGLSSAHGSHLNLGVRGEYDIARSEDGKRLTAYGEASQGVGHVPGHWYADRPQGEVGVQLHIPFNVPPKKED
uniref:Putative secreted salivary gland peptide ixodes scapularis secreted salivary gland peptide n=1 Tax=Amblyomma cajennense TaxID=34607 RepID=A0A023FFA7_AMBCJ